MRDISGCKDIQLLGADEGPWRSQNAKLIILSDLIEAVSWRQPPLLAFVDLPFPITNSLAWPSEPHSPSMASNKP